MKKASPQAARWALEAARADGDVLSFERLPGSPVRFRLEVRPTRLAHYQDSDSRGVLVLTSREVFAFVEGRWAARRIYPTRRAGDNRA